MGYTYPYMEDSRVDPRAVKLLTYLRHFFSGFTWPFSFLESRSASAGLFLSIFLIAPDLQ